MSEFGYCPQCGASGRLRERRPNGNDTGACGHVYPSKDALTSPVLRGTEPCNVVVNGESIEYLADYHNRLRPSVRNLADVMGGQGVERTMSDDGWVDCATIKIDMLFKMLVAAGVQEGVLEAAMRS